MPPATPFAWTGVRDPAQKREAVLRAAMRSFDTRRFPATSLNDVAAELRGRTPTIHGHFAKSDEVLPGCARRGADRLAALAQE